MNWNEFNYQFRETDAERNERLRKARLKRLQSLPPDEIKKELLKAAKCENK